MMAPFNSCKLTGRRSPSLLFLCERRGGRIDCRENHQRAEAVDGGGAHDCVPAPGRVSCARHRPMQRYYPRSAFGPWPRVIYLYIDAGHADNIVDLYFSPDGSKLASGSGDKTVRFWDLSTQTPEQTCSGLKQICDVLVSCQPCFRP